MEFQEKRTRHPVVPCFNLARPNQLQQSRSVGEEECCSAVRGEDALDSLAALFIRPILNASLRWIENLKRMVVRQVEKGEFDGMLLQHFIDQTLRCLHLLALERFINMK